MSLGAADFQIGTSLRLLTAMEDVGSCSWPPIRAICKARAARLPTNPGGAAAQLASGSRLTLPPERAGTCSRSLSSIPEAPPTDSGGPRPAESEAAGDKRR